MNDNVDWPDPADWDPLDETEPRCWDFDEDDGRRSQILARIRMYVRKGTPEALRRADRLLAVLYVEMMFKEE